MIKLYSVLLALALPGCAAMSGQAVAPPGQAVYHYERKADGTCTLDITSGRELVAPELILDKDCSFHGRAADTSGLAFGVQQQAAFLNAFLPALLTALKAAGVIVP